MPKMRAKSSGSFVAVFLLSACTRIISAKLTSEKGEPSPHVLKTVSRGISINWNLRRGGAYEERGLNEEIDGLAHVIKSLKRQRLTETVNQSGQDAILAKRLKPSHMETPAISSEKQKLTELIDAPDLLRTAKKVYIYSRDDVPNGQNRAAVLLDQLFSTWHSNDITVPMLEQKFAEQKEYDNIARQVVVAYAEYQMDRLLRRVERLKVVAEET